MQFLNQPKVNSSQVPDYLAATLKLGAQVNQTVSFLKVQCFGTLFTLFTSFAPNDHSIHLKTGEEKQPARARNMARAQSVTLHIIAAWVSRKKKEKTLTAADYYDVNF